MSIDLHCHSIYSDGDLTPLELLQFAETKKLRLFSITDHDTLKGTIIAKKLAEKFSFKYITGVEISANLSGKKYEVLGYNFDSNAKEINDALKFLRSSRKNRMELMIQKLNNIGVDITIQDVMLHVEEGGSPGRPNLAKALITKGYATSVAQAFEEYLNPGKPAYVKKKALEPKEIIEIIHKSGGIAILPHPLIFENKDEEKFFNMLEKFLKWKVDGFEVYYDYSTYTPPLPENLIATRIKQLKLFCKENNLLTTVGSDYHGYLGDIGSVKVPEEVENKLLQFFKNKTRKQ